MTSHFKTQDCGKSEMHQMTSELNVKNSIYRKAHILVSFVLQPFSTYKVVRNWKCTELPQNDFEHKTVKSNLHRLSRQSWGPNLEKSEVWSGLVYLTWLLSSQGLRSNWPGAGRWDGGWKGPRLEYTGFRTRDTVVWSRVFYRSTKRTVTICQRTKKPKIWNLKFFNSLNSFGRDPR